MSVEEDGAEFARLMTVVAPAAYGRPTRVGMSGQRVSNVHKLAVQHFLQKDDTAEECRADGVEQLGAQEGLADLPGSFTGEGGRGRIADIVCDDAER